MPAALDAIGDARLEARIENWRRTVLASPHAQHCASAEYRYRAPAGHLDLQNEQAPQSMPPLDFLDGWLLEEAWRAIDSRRQRGLLRDIYVYRCTPESASRNAGIRLYLFDEELWRARLALARALDFLAAKLNVAPQENRVSD